MHTPQKETPTSGSNHAAGVNTHNTGPILSQSAADVEQISTLQARAALVGATLICFRPGYVIHGETDSERYCHVFFDLADAALILEHLELLT